MELKLGLKLNCQVEISIGVNEEVRNLEIVNKVTEILGVVGSMELSRRQPGTDLG